MGTEYKQIVRDYLKEIEQLKKENAYQRTIIDNITEEHKGLAKENMELIKRVKLLEQDRDMYRNKYNKLEVELEQAEEDYRKLENEYLLLKNK